MNRHLLDSISGPGDIKKIPVDQLPALAGQIRSLILESVSRTGGHLASTAGTHFDSGDPDAADPIERVSCRPDFMILVYPVIRMDEKTHGGSKRNLLGRDPKPDLLDLFSNEKQVTANTPPAFLAHALDDKVVPPDNSRSFYEALRSCQVAAEFLELPRGGHGLNGYQGPMWDAWQTKSLEWLAKQKLVP